METPKPTPAYTKPTIIDYGDLRELTAAQTLGSVTDVPIGTPAVPPFLSGPVP